MGGFSPLPVVATASSGTLPRLDRVTVAGKPTDDLAPDTLGSILWQAGLGK
jgi:hypothetical protein